MPDALAGRMTDLVVSPELAQALTSANVSGFTTGVAVATFAEQGAFDVPAGTPPPKLLRLCVGDDLAADLSFHPEVGLTASQRALDVLNAYCDHLEVRELD